ncbi:MAG: ATPase [Bacteroidaceae bacterium]|nr:ATPase [Bacteroidaceae bacterium]
MRLIADSGSTKTDWCWAGGGQAQVCATQGINPFHQSEVVILDILSRELVPQLPSQAVVDEICFYGAGCTKEKSGIVAEALKTVFPSTTHLFVGSDMLGAARAVCLHEEGIACILGTGANSCLYDGTDIVSNVSPLGYILGDEGSAAYIGKRLVGDVLKCQFSAEVCDLFFQETHLDGPTIINKVYREPMPNRFLGQTSQFCQHHRDNPEILRFLIDCFTQFFVRNVKNYHRDDLPIHFVGSIAVVYEAELRDAATSLGLSIGKIIKAPLEGLLAYHNP